MSQTVDGRTPDSEIDMTLPASPRTIEVLDVPFGTVGDLTLRLDIIRPDPLPTAPMPAIVYVHGGGWFEGDKSQNRNQPLAERGFFTVSINYRLSHEAIYPAQLDDVKAAIRWLRRHARELHVDPQRIGVWGHSAGAHLAALAGTTGHLAGWDESVNEGELTSRVQAVAMLAGPTDVLQVPAWCDDPDSWPARLVGGPLAQRLSQARQANPIHFVKGGEPPFLVIHGGLDDLVPSSQSDLLVQALRAVGSDVRFEYMPDAGHEFGPDEPSGPASLALVQAFFAEVLGLGAELPGS